MINKAQKYTLSYESQDETLDPSIQKGIEKMVGKIDSMNFEGTVDKLKHQVNDAVKILMDKLKKAVKQTGVKEIAIGGGVSANSGIRTALTEAQQKFGWKTYIPKFEYTTDNAAMIAIVGHHKYLKKEFSDASITAKARYAL